MRTLLITSILVVLTQMAQAQLYRCSMLEWFNASIDGIETYPLQNFSFFYSSEKLIFGMERGKFRAMELPILKENYPTSFEAGDAFSSVSFYDGDYESNFIYTVAISGSGALIRAKCNKD